MCRKPFLASTMVFLILFSASLSADAQAAIDPQVSKSLAEARNLCNGLTGANKALAKRAGYDMDQLCSSLKSVQLPDTNAAVKSQQLVLPRDKRELVNVDRGSSERLSDADNKKQDDNKQVDSKPLPLFGYELFAGEPTTFQPGMQIPVEPDYTLGPGDELKIQLFGKLNETHDLVISRQGSVDFPQVGPISLTGLSFAQAKQLIQRKVAKAFIGVEVDMTLGDLRSMQVFVLGEAHRPGTYTVSSLSTLTNVLHLSGGVNNIASLRNIQLKRNGATVAELDLYDLLLKGDTSKDVPMQPGDTLYIPTVQQTASIDGQVRRPAVYELKGTVTAQQLIDLAGGLLPSARYQKVRIQRIAVSGFSTTVDIDLTTEKGRRTLIKSGDLLRIAPVVEEQQSIVTVSGHVHYPGKYHWHQGLKLSDLIDNMTDLKSGVDLDFSLIRREQPPAGRIETLFVDLGAVIDDSDSPANVSLFPRDQLRVFSNQLGRAQLVQEWVKELKLQARAEEMAQIVSIEGTVRSPGEYPLTRGMTVTQLVAAAGGLSEEAYRQHVEVSRYDFSQADQVVADHLRINLLAALTDSDHDIPLKPYDKVWIRTIPEFRGSLSIRLQGEVKFPGVYTFRRGERLSDVVDRAGGLTPLAHAEAAVFTRVSLRRQEAEQLEELRQRLQADIAVDSLEQANEEQTATGDDKQKILDKLDDKQALGRLVIDLSAILAGSSDDIGLKDGDLLLVPEQRQEISVIGEVQHPSAHQFKRRLTLDDYIELAGGTNNNADSKHLYVVKANGSVSLPRRSRWFRRQQLKIEPGDTIVVPLEIDRRRALAVWAEASAVIYQMSLGAVAIKGL